MSSSKRWTIRYGEMRLTSFLAEGGLKFEGLYDALSMPGEIVDLPDDVIAMLLQYEAIRDHRLSNQLKSLLRLRKNESWRKKGLELLNMKGRSRYLLSNHPKININLLRFPILKKDRSPEFCHQRHAIMEMADLSKLGFSATVLNELRKWDKQQ